MTPNALAPAPSQADLTACSNILAEGSRSFATAGLLLPRWMRGPAAAVYAFCRVADDAVDDGADPHASVRELERRLDGIYAGRPDDHPADRAFSAVVYRYGIPRAAPSALLEGFLWDAQGRRYATLDDVLGYSARVASSVGVMMSHLMGATEPAVLARACDLGQAMQLTNICRDVGEDAAVGRLYLPEQWLRRAGVEPEAFLAQPRFSPELGGVVADLLAVAERLYRRADEGIRALPRGPRVAMRAARLIYADIGRVIAANRYDSVNQRARTGGLRKLYLLLRASGSLAWRPGPVSEIREPSARFLIEPSAVGEAQP